MNASWLLTLRIMSSMESLPFVLYIYSIHSMNGMSSGIQKIPEISFSRPKRSDLIMKTCTGFWVGMSALELPRVLQLLSEQAVSAEAKAKALRLRPERVCP